MKISAMLSTLVLVGLAAAPALAAPKTYQVTGPVLAMTADTITVQKGSEKWELAVGSATLPPDVKVGSKVTITYSMTAASITSKDGMKSSGMMKPMAMTPANAPSAASPAMAPASH